MTVLELEALKTKIVAAPSGALERLGAALLGRLLDATVLVAHSSFQHGADAGTSGRQGRHLRVEAKRYGETSQLHERELLGELQQAIQRDTALEAWILLTTQAASEQLSDSLTLSGKSQGVAVIILDWQVDSFPALAALCASAPDLVQTFVSSEAAADAQALATSAATMVARIAKDLQAWCIGYDSARKASQASLSSLWHSQAASRSLLGQDAAGGDGRPRIRRLSPFDALDHWWNSTPRAPAVVTGAEGDGKTWATLDWLQERSLGLPIVLPVPASAVSSTYFTDTEARHLLAARLRAITTRGDLAYWDLRVERLLQRPATEGPVFVLFLDGLNQAPSINWISLLQVLQDARYAGKVRVIATTRLDYFEGPFKRANALTDRAVRVPVSSYDLQPGGELDQMLQRSGLRREDLAPDLVELARRPRMFGLVTSLRGTLSAGTGVTVHQVLWEYGRDSLGRGDLTSFSEDQWWDWLHGLAERFRAGIATFPRREIEERIARPTLSSGDVLARVSDIIDGHFTTRSASRPDLVTFQPTMVAHALGLALLSHLEENVPTSGISDLQSRLDKWLDPIAGLDQRAEILRAAVSIMAVRPTVPASPVGGLLVTAWLHSQNLPETHRQDLAALCGELVDPLLDAIEASTTQAFTSARLEAVNALQALAWSSRSEQMRAPVVRRLVSWCGIVSLERGVGRGAFEKARAARLKERLGIDTPSDLCLFGVPLRILPRDDGTLANTAAQLLDGANLSNALPALKATALGQAATGDQPGWNAMKWLAFLDSNGAELRRALRAMAADLTASEAPSTCDRTLPLRVAALLLRLAGDECDEIEAHRMTETIGDGRPYEDYLADPSQQLIPLERRHAAIVLADPRSSLLWRVQRCGELWLDPTFSIPEGIEREIQAWAASVDVSQLDGSRARTREAHDYEVMEPALARASPGLLEELTRKRLLRLGQATATERYWVAVKSPEHLLLAGTGERAAARTLREAPVEASTDYEAFVRNCLLLIETIGLASEDQLDCVRTAKPSAIFDSLLTVLCPLSAAEAERAERATEEGGYALLAFLSLSGAPVPDPVWEWLVQVSAGSGDRRGLAFEVLARADPKRFGHHLATAGWSWSPTSSNANESHFAASALIEGATSLPFDQLAMRLPPSRLLEAARKRGADPADVRFAAEVFGRVLMGVQADAPDLGANVSMDMQGTSPGPRTLRVSERAMNSPTSTPQALAFAMDIEAQQLAFKRVVEAAVARIKEARASGAHLFLQEVSVDEMLCVLEHAPEVVNNWLDGVDGITRDLQRRIMLAEGAYLALCEALLAKAPERGVKLWHALSASLRTRFIGGAGVPVLTHLPFKAPDSGPVMALRAELLDIGNCNTDEELRSICLAAAWNGRASWLNEFASQDVASGVLWRRKRAMMIRRNDVAGEAPQHGWHEGLTTNSYERAERRTARCLAQDQWAQTWWKKFLAAPTVSEAYAAWTLFLRCIDRRARLWLRQSGRTGEAPLEQVKLAHANVNHHQVKRSIEKREGKLDEHFLDLDIAPGIGPWRDLR